MKTCLFSPCYLDGDDKLGNNRLERNLRYLNYYWPLREELDFQSIVLADNCSSVKNLAYLQDLAPAPVAVASALFFAMKDTHPIQVARFEEHLAFGSTGFAKDDPRMGFDYPYCWRALDVIRDLFGPLGFEKVIVIDSDGFVLSERLARYIRVFDFGWATLWCQKYGFPESSLQVITKAGFERYPNKPWQSRVGEIMEWALPYTNVDKSFLADRFGEARTLVTPEMDFYGQAPLDIEMKYRGIL